MNIRFLLNEPTYSSFERAVDASQNTIRARQAKSDNIILKRLSIIDYSMMESSVEFLLSDRKILRIFIDGKNVTWQIVEGRLREGTCARYHDKIRLNLSGNEHIIWVPEELLKCRIGKQGIAIAPTHTLVYLYVKGCDDLMFGQMVDLATNKQLLFYEES